MGLSKKEEREYARHLYVTDRLTFNEIAERAKVTPKTVSKWCDEDKWDEMRKSLLIAKDSQLVHWYNQLDAINEKIHTEQGNIPTNAQADTMSKITANIQRLETETNIGEYISVGKKVLVFIQDIDLDDAKRFKNYFDEFISSRLKSK